MAQATLRSADLRPRERFWLDHLRTACRQGQTLKAYAQTHGLSVARAMDLFDLHPTVTLYERATD